VVVIKKERDVMIEKPIGAIFKRVNIVEYKSPRDYLSIGDFHKTGACARLYSALYGVDITDMTVSFVAEARPQKLLDYLRKVYRYEVREEWPGIYHVRGDILGIQIIEVKRLGEGEAVWLKALRGGLNGERLRKIIEISRGMPKGAPLSAYIYILLQANVSGFREVLAMSDASFEEVLEEFGLTAKWEAKGREEGREESRGEAVKRLQKYGMDPGQIAEALGLPLGTVFRYLNAE
jgi:hypothetical protein